MGRKDICLNEFKAAGRFDRALNFQMGNVKLQNILNDNLIVSLYKLVHPDDSNRLQNILLQSERENTKAREILRFLRDDDYVPFIFEVEYEKEEDGFYIELLDAELSDFFIHSLQTKVDELRAYLTVENNILINYDSESEIFKLFWTNNNNDVVIYEDNFTSWQTRMIEKGFVEGESDIQVFNTACEMIRKCKGTDSLTFNGKIITKGDRIDCNRLKFQPLEREGEIVGVVGKWMLFNEITQEIYEDFCEESYKDMLTGLLNKKYITAYAHEVLLDSDNERVAFVMMDLDNFKDVNDTYGHMFGDEVLKTAGDIIKSATNGYAMAGRMGGDEFFIVFKDYENETHLRNILRTIKINIAAMYKGRIGDITISCSIGASRSDLDSRDYDELFKVADKALYIAKEKGKNRYIIYKTEIHGEFAFAEESKQVSMKTQYYNRTELRNICIKFGQLVASPDRDYVQLFKMIAKALHFDRIGVYLKGSDKPLYEYKRDTYDGIVSGNGRFLEFPEYINMFENDYLVIENMNNLEYMISGAFEIFKNISTKSTLQMLIKDYNEIVGVVSFDVCSEYVTIPTILNDYVHAYANFISGMVLEEIKRDRAGEMYGGDLYL